MRLEVVYESYIGKDLEAKYGILQSTIPPSFKIRWKTRNGVFKSDCNPAETVVGFYVYGVFGTQTC
jgi:hypothetical protein